MKGSGNIPNLLSIAGSDPSGGAGIQADLKTFAALECHGMAALTSLTAQNSRGIRAIHTPPADFLAAQIDAIFADIDVAAVKIGMLGNSENVAVVADRLNAHAPPFTVLDAVLAASSGDSLGGGQVSDAIARLLLPVADLVTPNAPEAARLTGQPEALDLDGQRRLAEALIAMGARAVLIKGGHIRGVDARDLFLDRDGELIFSAPWVETNNTHGTGCALSSAIAAYVAKGADLRQAIGLAKEYLTRALQGGDALRVGGGHGPVHHFWRQWPQH